MLPAQSPPDDRHLRQFAGAGVCVAWLLFVLRSARSSQWLIACAVLTVLILVLAWRVPQAFRIPYLFLSALTRPLGWLISTVLFGLLYFGVLLPVGVLLRIVRGDVLGRIELGEGGSYFSERPSGARRFFSQY